AKLGGDGLPTGVAGNGGNGAGAGGSTSGAGPASAGGNGSVSAASPTATLPSAPVPESAGILQMRRLTYTEYDNSLGALIGDTTRPAEDPTHPWAADTLGTN